MVLNPRRITFHTFQDMAAHLDGWAENGLGNAVAWGDMLVSSRQWLDYSARNQVLLASYGADGPVAGAETWGLVPSADGRKCAVRAGEHGLPVRVPITTSGNEPDPYLGGSRPTRAAVERFEWRPVFSTGQLARRPAPEALTPVDVPVSLVGDGAGEAYLDAVRHVAKATVRGRLPRSTDPDRVVADAASRLRRSAKRPELTKVQREQVAWLVADRVALATGELPEFDPGALAPRERWERLQDVLEPARKLTAALGVQIGVDLTASPLPRMEIVDDRVVPATRRHRLPAASLEQLAVGQWVEVGPYTPNEWAARGERGSGKGAYLRLNRSAYVVAVEQGHGAAWRLEDVGARTGQGLLATGNAGSLRQARDDAVAALHGRYPALATVDGASDHGEPTTSNSTRARAVADPAERWVPVPGRGTSKAEMRRINDTVTIYAIPMTDDRWLPAVQFGPSRTLERLPMASSREEARDAAELAGRRAAHQATLNEPARFDHLVADLAANPDYSRDKLADLLRDRLDPDPAARVPDADPTELVELLGSADVTPATTVQVLRAEDVPATDVARLLPIFGVPMDDAIRVLHKRWDMTPVAAAEALDATAVEMRAAGCTPTEIMASRPRDVLRALPDDPHLWEVAAGTMALAGVPSSQSVRHLIAHAPTAETFAAGLAVAVDDAREAISLAACHGAQPDQLAAASEQYALTPTETAGLLADAGTAAQVGVETIYLRCDEDSIRTAQIAGTGLGLSDEQTNHCLEVATTGGNGAEPVSIGASAGDPTPAASRAVSIDPNDSAALLEILPPPGPATDVNDAALLEMLPDPTTPTIATPDLTGAET